MWTEFLASSWRRFETVGDVNGKIVFGPTKNYRTRWVSLPSSIAECLANHLAHNVGPELDALVFRSPEGAPLRHTNFMRDIWRPATKRAELDWVTPHVLRHTAATLLIDAGASIKDVQRHLGHADAAVTLNIYSSVMEGRSDDLVKRLEAIRSQAEEAK